ncbi:TIGR03089 family protein [Streptomyces sp. SID3343]|uniref:TIGR03089 family protein n=1 Tax=Streptomyces sp. SID3343 TaxID=2690260 RepID=UPI001367D3FC|nr:TIGR03089 family protein [Streptomyces sp. SID3343]MYW00052.1 TIGR03089 family protein [Streptomyces sp. SID3343]
MPSTPVDQLRSALAADSARPFTTFYDDATGERVELSVATFDNWVAKTANLLRDDFDAQPGDRVCLLLPAHWQTQVWLLAAWSLGLVATFDGDPAEADLVVSGPDTLDLARTCPGERIALALRPMGGRFPTAPAGFVDYAAEVAGHGDRFVPDTAPGAADPALEVAGRTLTAAEVADEGEAAAKEWGLTAGDRVLSSLTFARTGGLRAGLLAPLAASVPVVLCRHLDESALEHRIAAERVTRVVTRSAD